PPRSPGHVPCHVWSFRCNSQWVVAAGAGCVRAPRRRKPARLIRMNITIWEPSNCAQAQSRALSDDTLVRNRPSRQTTCSVTAELDDKGQFADLMAAYAAPIRRLCATYAESPADREDLFQDIFLAVWLALPGFRRQASVRTWLYRIAHNVALTRRTRDRHPPSPERPLDQEAAAPPGKRERVRGIKRRLRPRKWISGASR